MRIAVASGKGGTGKTTVATNLARVLSRKHKVQYLDCDVEEPNGHLFLRPRFEHVESVEIPIPEVDKDRCTNCGECSALCAYHAIACLGVETIVFPELCHGCGGCRLVCPEGAIREVGRPIGIVETANARGIGFVHGRLEVGEAMSPPLIRVVCEHVDPDAISIFDAPPGTSCPVVASVRGADVVLLVAEPTAFGLHDLTLAVETIGALSLPLGVFINQCDIGDDRVERFCEEHGLPIWGRLPHDRRVAEAYSRGQLAADAVPGVRERFESLADVLMGETSKVKS